MNVFEGNTPPEIELGKILALAKMAFKLPEIVTSFANVAFSATANVLPSVTAPPTLIVRLNDASRSTFRLFFAVIALVTNNRSLRETSLSNAFAGNTPPEIELDGMITLAKLAFKLPEIVRSFANMAFSATANVLPSVTAPLTLMVRLNDASRSTFRLSLVVIALVTNNRSLRETSLLNVFAGNTPPEIELG